MFKVVCCCYTLIYMCIFSAALAFFRMSDVRVVLTSFGWFSLASSALIFAIGCSATGNGSRRIVYISCAIILFIHAALVLCYSFYFWGYIT